MAEISFSKYSSLILRHNLDILNREISIIGSISTLTYIKFDKLLKILEVKPDDITLILNTRGGNISAAFAIIDRIDRSPNNIHIIATGEVMSAGLDILASGTTRRATKHTTFMHHGLSSNAPNFENIPMQESNLKVSKETDKMRFKGLAEKTNKPYSFWASCGKHVDYTFYIDEALEYGLIEEVI